MSTNGYKVHQPSEIISFIGDAVKAMGWKMETVGSLRGGRKVWALANIGDAGQTGQFVLDLDGGIVAQVEGVKAALRRREGDHQEEAR